MDDFIIFVLGMFCGAVSLIVVAVLEHDRKNKK